MSSTVLPSSLLRNSPRLLSSLSAFHCLGLWLAVMMMPPSASAMVTASSVVGVVARPMSMTSNPIPMSVPQTMLLTISREMRASLPTTTFLFLAIPLLCRKVAYAVVNFTMSSGLSVSPAWPPIVPLMPEMDLISVIYLFRRLIHNNRGKHSRERTACPGCEAR